MAHKDLWSAAEVARRLDPGAILELLTVALSYVAEKTDVEVHLRAHRALDGRFENGRKHGYEEGYRAGMIAAGEAETAATLIIEGLCRKEGQS